MTAIAKFEIEGFRSFGAKQTLHLAVPNGSPGSGLTAITGPNGGGKSALLEAAAICDRGNAIVLSRDYRNNLTRYRTNLVVTYKDGTFRGLRSNGTNPEQLTTFQSSPEELTHPRKTKDRQRELLLFIDARRELPSQIGEADPFRSNWLNRDRKPHERQPEPDVLNRRVRRWQDGSSRFHQLLHPLIDLQFQEHTEGTLLRVELGGFEHSVTGLGRGITALVNLVDAIDDAPDGASIWIDEPELSLHPSLQRRYYDLLYQESSRLQIVYATHSPYFVDWRALVNGAKLARVVRYNGQPSAIAQLEQTTIKDVAKLRENLNNPHILGTNANEVFFLTDRVVLVEGQEDVVFYRMMADEVDVKLKGAFYGWGAGSADNMPQITQMLHELGFRSAVGLLDKGKATLRDQLARSYPNFAFELIDADDVRDKPTKNIKGLCTTDGEIHPDRREYVRDLIDRVNQHLAP